MIDVRLYLDNRNKSPYLEWLEDLKDIKARAKIKVRIDRLRMGNLGDHRSVGNGVLELKIDFGPGYRIYFGRDGSDLVLLLCGGNKSTQARDIVEAKKYWLDYQEYIYEKK